MVQVESGDLYEVVEGKVTMDFDGFTTILCTL